jgi:hypothetical protein
MNTAILIWVFTVTIYFPHGTALVDHTVALREEYSTSQECYAEMYSMKEYGRTSGEIADMQRNGDRLVFACKAERIK